MNIQIYNKKNEYILRYLRYMGRYRVIYESPRHGGLMYSETSQFWIQSE